MASPSKHRHAIAELVDRIVPGGHVIRTRRLRGGLSCRMDLLEIERPDGSAYKVSLRRFEKKQSFSVAERAAQEFAVLSLLETAAITAPRPILLDADGTYFDVPAIVLSYLPGRPLFAEKNIAAWTAGLASALGPVHAITADRFDLSGLRSFGREGLRERATRLRSEETADLLVKEVCTVLVDGLDRLTWLEPNLIHDDYWPGNTIWFRNRILGIIDWSAAKLGDKRADVAQCRLDLVISHGVDVAEMFRADYETRFGPLPNLWYFDLSRGIEALRQHEQWLVGYHDIGLRHLEPAAVEQRLREFLRRALRAREP